MSVSVIITIITQILSIGVMTGMVVTKISNLEKIMQRWENLEIPSRIAVAENSIKSAHHRIDDVEKILTIIK